MQATHQKHPTFNLEGTLQYLLAAGQLLTLHTRCTLLGLFALPPIPQPLRKQNNNKRCNTQKHSQQEFYYYTKYVMLGFGLDTAMRIELDR